MLAIEGFERTLTEYVRTQAEWSQQTFGWGHRTKGLTAHIRKELEEIEAAPNDLMEWIDVMILAFDGYWRAGGRHHELMSHLVVKQRQNMRRAWPPVGSEDKPVEHVREEPK